MDNDLLLDAEEKAIEIERLANELAALLPDADRWTLASIERIRRDARAVKIALAATVAAAA